MKNWWIVFADVSSIETGGTVEAAAAPAEEGASGEHTHGGKGQGGSRPRVYKALLWDAGWLQVRFVFNPITSVSALFLFVALLSCSNLCFSERLLREREILEERAEKRHEIFKDLIHKMATAASDTAAQETVTKPL